MSLKICLLAPVLEPVPPPRYGGTERIVAALAEDLAARGHDVTLFAAGDSTAPVKIVPVVPRALWPAGFRGDPAPAMARVVAAVEPRAAEFDLIHSHIEGFGFALARHSATPLVTTLHGRLDRGPAAELLPRYPDVPLIAVSHSQRRSAPGANWLATIHNGLPLRGVTPGAGDGGYLAFVGRITPEKGIADAIVVARRAGLPLVVAAKAFEGYEARHFEEVMAPAVGRGDVRFLGEVDSAERDRLLGGATATLMMGEWPEPFGLVAIESLAAGTPVIARRTGALPEIVRDGIDGFLIDDAEGAVDAVARVARLDRRRIHVQALTRFSAERMVDEYEAVYAVLLGGAAHAGRRLAIRVRGCTVWPIASRAPEVVKQ